MILHNVLSIIIIYIIKIIIISENTTGYNGNTITDTVEEMEKISPFWSFNDSVDLTKYEQFDHQRFIGKSIICLNNFLCFWLLK